MSSEINVRGNLQIRAGNTNYSSPVQAFIDDMAGRAGPTPGSILVDTDGVNVDLSELTQPTWCEIINQSEITDNYIEYGLWVPDTGTFLPLGEVAPGQSTVLKLSRNLGRRYEGDGTGTGPESPSDIALRLRAGFQSAYASVNAFEK